MVHLYSCYHSLCLGCDWPLLSVMEVMTHVIRWEIKMFLNSHQIFYEVVASITEGPFRNNTNIKRICNSIMHLHSFHNPYPNSSTPPKVANIPFWNSLVWHREITFGAYLCNLGAFISA